MTSSTKTTSTEAERRAKRINSKLNRKYPLIASLIATNADEQTLAIQRIKSSEEARLARSAELDRVFIERATQYKAELVELIGPEKVELLSAERQKMKDRFYSLCQPCYEADFWRCHLRKQLAIEKSTNQPDGMNDPP